MAGRRRRVPRGRARRETFWVDLAVEKDQVNGAAGALRTVTLYQPATDQDKVTVVRIVGSIFLSLQAAQATVTAGYRGIYASGDTGMSPDVASTIGDEDWMWWTALPLVTGESDGADFQNIYSVDIRVKRKLDLDKPLVLSLIVPQAPYASMVNLRGLMMLP